jgi:hypothetical protein
MGVGLVTKLLSSFKTEVDAHDQMTEGKCCWPLTMVLEYVFK